MLTTTILKRALHAKHVAIDNVTFDSDDSIISRVRQDVDFNPLSSFDGLVNIGVDETSYKKDHKYITAIVSHVTGKVICIHEGHGKSAFSMFIKQLTKEQRDSIRLVSGDEAKWIQACIDEYCPDAERCIDPLLMMPLICLIVK